MIISGGSRRNGGFFARHLINPETNARVELSEISGLTADSIAEAFKEMEAVAKGTRCKNYFYHANINPRDHERLTPEQWRQAVDVVERNLRLIGQPRFVVEHEKEGRVHRHVIWSRIDIDTMKAISDSKTAFIHERTSRELEIAFGLDPVPSVLTADRDGPRPDRGPKSWEMFRGLESGLDPRDVTTTVTALWQQTDSGRTLHAALEAHGYILAKGDRRDFVIIDPAGDDHSLPRRVKGVKVADVRVRMADVDRNNLPSVDEAREMQRARQAERGEDRQREEGDGRPADGDAHKPDRQRGRKSGKGSSGRAVVATTNAGLVAQQREAMRLLTKNQRLEALRAAQRAEARNPDRDNDGGRRRPRGR